MPAKQTRESIEAELNAGERERAQQLLNKAIQDFHELEKDLKAARGRGRLARVL
jgi:hypothetical protein